MRKILMTTTCGLLLGSAAAMAQTASPAQSETQSQPAGHASPTLRADISESLGKAGFSDVRVMPDSFVVQAKDKSGNPVSMFIGPNSVTELVQDGTASQGGPAARGGSGDFVAVDSADMVSSKVIGTEVRNDANQDIGTIKDVALSGGRLQAYVLSVGSFLGMGDHYVAVSPSAMQVTYDHTANAWRATLNATQAQLKAAPAYTYLNG